MTVYCETEKSINRAERPRLRFAPRHGALNACRWGGSLETPGTTFDSFRRSEKVPHFLSGLTAESGRAGFVQEHNQ